MDRIAIPLRHPTGSRNHVQRLRMLQVSNSRLVFEARIIQCECRVLDGGRARSRSPGKMVSLRRGMVAREGA